MTIFFYSFGCDSIIMETCRVWCKFSVKCSDGIINLRIQDMPKNRFDEVFDLFAAYFPKEETMHKAAGFPNNDEAIKELNVFIREMLTSVPHHITICCKDGDPDTAGEIIGASIMKIYKKEDDIEEHVQPKFKEVKKLFELMGELYVSLDKVEGLNYDSFYDDRGIVVLPAYRGLGIAQQFFHVRRLICKDAGISMTGAWVTSIPSQKACHKDGWETIYEIPYDELGKKMGVTFEDVPPTCKFMIARA